MEEFVGRGKGERDAGMVETGKGEGVQGFFEKTYIVLVYK